jgi:hypothetical protein
MVESCASRANVSSGGAFIHWHLSKVGRRRFGFHDGLHS